MKTQINVTQLTKGFTVEIKNQKGLLSAYVFETSESMGKFFQDYFDKPVKTKVIRRPKVLVKYPESVQQ